MLVDNEAHPLRGVRYSAWFSMHGPLRIVLLVLRRECVSHRLVVASPAIDLVSCSRSCILGILRFSFFTSHSFLRLVSLICSTPTPLSRISLMFRLRQAS